ncbi:SDR family NAD(P)-dependent oxidoreductase [bacterium]|nr:SDR family NAD(P)-dependent oxidoreductase [bacterium]NUP93230.1 SDR family NAD(P)-dependent oxidoreductase [Candidatus Omnitrophota bacterium]
MRILITGGVGFIGCHTCARFAKKGAEVVAFDNLSRRGSCSNADWLKREHAVRIIQGDIRHSADLEACFLSEGPFDAVIHLAAQVAVTTSVTNPREDFDINALGTFNVLEAARAQNPHPVMLYASTNKVYGGMEDIVVVEDEDRYRYRDLPAGIPVSYRLDFHSPYGCSKGAADQYVRDYSRIYGIPTVVLRQSCIYGTRQFGIEDQGWVAWFVIAAVFQHPIVIYGNGKQVRDVLYVEDLVNAYEQAIDRRDQVAGRIFNIGGGPDYALSIWKEFGPLLENLLGRKIPVSYSDWRPGDQPVYISDITETRTKLGWEPRIKPAEGIRNLYDWVLENKDLVAQELGFR